MTSLEFEKELIEHLVQWVAKAHPDLAIEVDNARLAEGADFVVKNKQSGQMLAVEIKAARDRLPVGIFPSLKRMNEYFTKAGHKFVVLSSTPASSVLSSNVEKSRIPFLQIAKPTDAAPALEPILRSLEVGDHT